MTFWRTAALRDCRTRRRSKFRTRRYPPRPFPRTALREPVPTIYRTTGSDVAADGGDLAGRPGCVYAATGVGATAGRLSDDPGVDVLSRREPGRDGDDGDGPAGTAIWTIAGIESDDVDELRRNVGDRAAVRAGVKHRRR